MKNITFNLKTSILSKELRYNRDAFHLMFQNKEYFQIYIYFQFSSLQHDANPCKRGSYMCVCDDGYLGNGDIGCTDKDECQLNEDNCAANAEPGVKNDTF